MVNTFYKALHIKHPLLFIAASVLGGHFMVAYGTSHSFFELLLMPRYYAALVGSTFIAVILLGYISWISHQLDQRYDWLRQPWQRAMLQLLFGMLIAGLLAFFLACAYFYFKGEPILNTLYLLIDFPVIMVLLFIANFYHVFHNILQRATSKEATPVQEVFAASEGRLMVSSGNKVVAIAFQDIAYVISDGENRFLHTFDGSAYLVNYVLDELEQVLDGTFFRATRQLIVQHKACELYKDVGHRKLELTLNVPFKEQIVISQLRSKDFKQWFES